MKKVLQIGGYIVAGLAALIVIIVIILKLISDNQYKQWLISAVESATGREFNIESLELDFNTTVRASASQINLANADWSENPDMLRLESMKAEINLLKLISGTAQFRGVFDGLSVIQETNTEGFNNWALTTDESPGLETDQPEAQQQDSEPGLPIDFLIEEFRISNSTIDIIQAEEKNNINAVINEFLVETPQTDTTINLDAAVNDTPLELGGNLGQLSGLIYDQSSPLSLRGMVGKNTIDINGDWGPLLPEPTLNLKTDVDIIARTPLADIFGLDIIDFGPMDFSLRLAASDGLFSVSEILTDLDGSVSDIRLSGSIEDLLNLQGLEIITDASTLELTTLLEKFNIQLPVSVPQKVNFGAEIYGGLDKLGAREIEVLVADEGVDIKFEGQIENALTAQGIEGLLKGRIDSTSDLSSYAGMELPDLGSLDISAGIVSNEDRIGLTDLVATLSSENIQVDITGRIEDLVAVKGIQLEIDTGISSFSAQNINDVLALLQEYDISVPPEFLPENARLHAVVAGDLERLGVADIEAEVNDQGISVGLKGQVDDVIKANGVNAEISFKSDSLSSLSKYAGVELPATDALEAYGQVESGDDTYRLNELQASLLAQGFNLKLDASINDLLTLKGIDAQLESQIDSLSVLSELANTELPRTDPVSLSASLSSSQEDVSNPAAISVSAVSNETKVQLDANLGDLMSIENMLAAVDIQAASLSDLNQFAGTQLPDQGPLKITGNLKAEGKTYGLHDFTIDLNEQTITGWANASLPESEDDITSVNAELDIPYFDLSAFIPDASQPSSEEQAESTSEAEGEGESSEETAGTDSDRVFSANPLPLDALRKINADVAITAEKLKVRKADITDFNLTLKMKDGLLSIEPLSAESQDGTLNGTLVADGRSDNLVMDIDVVIEKFPIIQLQGTYDMNLNLEGSGTSMAELMASIDGQVVTVIHDATIEESFATNFGSGLFSFSEDEDTTEIECGILRMDIEDGYVDFDDKLAVQLTEVTWHGGGHIDLNTEEIGVAVVPSARKGIGIGAGELASLLYVDGTLKNPSPRINPADIAVKYGKYMAHVSTGGLSLLAGVLYKKIFANQDLCAEILEGTIFDTEPAQE